MTLSTLVRTAGAAGVLVAALSGCGGDRKSTPTGESGAGATTDKIEVINFAYNPESATVKAGTPVTWTFADNVDHNVEPVGASELQKSPDLKDGKTYAFTFTKPGEVNYRCGIHNSMTGTVVVTA